MSDRGDLWQGILVGERTKGGVSFYSLRTLPNFILSQFEVGSVAFFFRHCMLRRAGQARGVTAVPKDIKTEAGT